VTAVLNGLAVVGVEPEHFDVICGPARKVAERDLGVAVAQQWVYGATTVSASLALAAAAGVEVFATGGLGGVHRDVGESMDVSSDLRSLSAHPVVTVSSGAKVFLDSAKTLEYLETSSVPVLGFCCDEFPAFYVRSSGLPVPHRVDSPEEVAAIARHHWDLGGAGILVANPVPEADAIAAEVLEAAVAEALGSAARAGVVGAAITPVVLAEIARLTEGRSVATNLALAESNATVAAEIAVALMVAQY
jgi:pseudouridine-5'-phosphate glycosidase